MQAVQRRTLRVLIASQVLGGVGITSGIVAAGLLAEEFSGSTALSGLAQTATVLGAATAALPMARLMAWAGRRPGLVAGYGTGAAGALVVVASSVLSDGLLRFPLLLFGALLFGAANAAGLQARFAATDLAPADRRGRALAVVVWATTVGAVLGPNLVEPGAAVARRVGLPPLAGAYLFSLLSLGLAGSLLLLLLRPDPLLLARAGAAARADVPAGVSAGDPVPSRPSLRAVAGVVRLSERATLGLVAIVVGHALMIAVMVMTPVHLHHAGATLQVVGLVISVHVAGMYALAPVVGFLVDRAGRPAVIVLGSVVAVVAVTLAGAAEPSSTGVIGLGLFLLGLGWSCSLVAGSTLLSDSVPLAVRPSVQGAADFAMGLGGAGAGAAAGVVLGIWGYGALAAGAGALVVPVLALVVALSRHRSPPEGGLSSGSRRSSRGGHGGSRSRRPRTAAGSST